LTDKSTIIWWNGINITTNKRVLLKTANEFEKKTLFLHNKAIDIIKKVWFEETVGLLKMAKQ